MTHRSYFTLCLVVSISLALLVHQTLCYYHDDWFDPARRENYFTRKSYNEDPLYFPDSNDNYYNPPWSIITTTSKPVYNVQDCISSCQDTSTFGPVCGTDDVTYRNINNLRCAARCGVDVRTKIWSACPQSNLNDPRQSRSNLQACMKVCPTTPEYNPVCGTDNVTYNNVGKLYCAKECGADVELKRQMPCPPSTTPTTQSPDGSSKIIQNCIARCPVTSEYYPVCGSNDVTYKNIGSLECARECGADVTLRGRSACYLLATPAPTTSELPLIDRMTTKSTSFTIAQEILDSIFTKSPINEDLEPNIDPRYNHKK